MEQNQMNREEKNNKNSMRRRFKEQNKRIRFKNRTKGRKRRSTSLAMEKENNW